MQRVTRCALVVAAALLPATAAQASLALAQKNACMTCHAVDRKLVGPSYQEVVKRHAGDQDAGARLADSIRKGGSGKYGPVPMPAQATLSETDARTLADWILGGAK